MLKVFLLILSVFFVSLLGSIFSSNAYASPNVYCIWEGPISDGNCQTYSDSITHCDPGFYPDESICPVKDYANCNGFVVPCITDLPPDQDFACIDPGLGCVPVEAGSPGSFTNIDACNASCGRGEKYSCDNRSGCYPDENGTFETFNACFEGCVVDEVTDTQPTPIPFNLCDQAGDKVSECNACVYGGDPGENPGQAEGVWTAVGCIPTSDRGIVSSFVQIGVGASGGVVVISFLGGGILITISKGDQEKLKEAKAMITAAIGGALFILFSMVLLQTIGISVLRIPGF